MPSHILKQIEGVRAGEVVEGEPEDGPVVGKPFRFFHDYKTSPNAPDKCKITSPVQHVTNKKERTIIRTENSVYSLEKKPQ